MSISKKKADRIRAVQSRMHEIAEWKLASIQRAKMEVENQQKAVIETLNEEQFRPLLVDVVARRLKVLAKADQRLAAEVSEQSLQVREQGMRLKRAERMADKAGAAEQQVKDKAALDEILEAFISSSKASLPPA